MGHILLDIKRGRISSNCYVTPCPAKHYTTLLLLLPGLLVIGVHQLASIRLLPTLDTSNQNFSLDLCLFNFVEVVLHPASTSWASTTAASWVKMSTRPVQLPSRLLTAIKDDSLDTRLFDKVIDLRTGLIQSMSGEIDRCGDSAALPVRPSHID